MKLIKNTIYFTLIIISLIIFFHFFLILFADSYRFIFSKKDKINPNEPDPYYKNEQAVKLRKNYHY